MTNQLANDITLFTGIAAGNEDDFKQFYEQTRARIFSYCLKMTHSSPDALELVQETYLSLWEGRKSLHQVNYPYAYLLRIASRCVSHFLVSSAKHRQGIAVAEASTQTIDTVETRNILYLVEKAVLRLPPRQQHVFRLCKYEGLSYQQIAAQLHIAVPTVSRTLAEAMKKIRHAVTGGA